MWIANAGTYGALIAMVLTALIVIPIGFVYAELCTSLKVAGGEFAYTYKFLGRFPAFVSGWFLILGYLAILPWVALSVSSLFSYLIPSLKTFPIYTILDNTLYVPELIISLIMVWGLTFINLKGIQASKMFQNAATIMLLASFAIFFAGCFLVGDTVNLEPTFSEKGVIQGIFMAIASMLFFMNGFDTIAKTSDEADQNINVKNLGNALVGTIFAGSALYLLIILASSLIMVPGSSVNLGSLPLIQAFENATGSKILVFILIFGTFMGVTTTFNGFLLAGSKLLASFAASGFMSSQMGAVDNNNIPRKALVLMSTLSTLGLFMGKGLLAPLITMGGISFLIAWFLVACSTLQFNRQMPELERPFKVPGGKMMIWFAIIISGTLTALMVIPGTLISLGAVENILLVTWIVVGILIYFIYRNQQINLIEIK